MKFEETTITPELIRKITHARYVIVPDNVYEVGICVPALLDMTNAHHNDVIEPHQTITVMYDFSTNKFPVIVSDNGKAIVIRHETNRN